MNGQDVLTRVVVYWAEAGGETGWCYAAHYTREGTDHVDTAPIDGAEDWSESQAVAWVRAKFGADVPIGIGADDIV